MEKHKEYFEVSKKIKALEARKKVLKSELELEYGPEKCEDKQEYGTFKMVPTTRYKFTSRLNRRIENVEISKINEIEKGEATPTTTYGLRFNAVK